jgi:hypothetical protein
MMDGVMEELVLALGGAVQLDSLFSVRLGFVASISRSASPGDL